MLEDQEIQTAGNNDLLFFPLDAPDAQMDTRSLEELEGAIERGLKTFMEVGKALAYTSRPPHYTFLKREKVSENLPFTPCVHPTHVVDYR